MKKNVLLFGALLLTSSQVFCFPSEKIKNFFEENRAGQELKAVATDKLALAAGAAASLALTYRARFLKKNVQKDKVAQGLILSSSFVGVAPLAHYAKLAYTKWKAANTGVCDDIDNDDKD